MARVLVIPDLHCPFEHPDAFAFCEAVYNKYKCNRVVNLGDEVDFHAMSPKYIANPNGMSPQDELTAAKEKLKVLYKLFPNVSVCISNHTARPFRAAKHYGIPDVFIRSYHEFFEAPSTWTWEDHFNIDGVRYVHGEGVSGKYAHERLATANRQSTVHGHVHSFAGFNFLNNVTEQPIFGMNCGWLGDLRQYAFEYGKAFLHKPVLSCGAVIEGFPYIELMATKTNGRWTGRLVA